MSSAVDSLDLLSLFYDRLSHALRTPLGVCQGLVEDLLRGLELSRSDLEDGTQSIRKMVAILDSLKDFTGKNQFNPIRLRLGEFLNDELAAYYGGAVVFEQPAEQLNSIAIFADAKLLGRAIRLAATYLISRNKRSKENDRRKSAITVTVRSGGRLCIQMKAAGEPARLDSEELRFSAESLLQSDHSIECLGVIFAERILRMHDGGIALIERGPAGENIATEIEVTLDAGI